MNAFGIMFPTEPATPAAVTPTMTAAEVDTAAKGYVSDLDLVAQEMTTLGSYLASYPRGDGQQICRQATTAVSKNPRQEEFVGQACDEGPTTGKLSIDITPSWGPWLFAAVLAAGGIYWWVER